MEGNKKEGKKNEEKNEKKCLVDGETEIKMEVKKRKRKN